MKIRTRLFLFLLPPLIGSIALISTLLAFQWRREIVEGFQTRLKSALHATASMMAPQTSYGPVQSPLSSLLTELQISDLTLSPPNGTTSFAFEQKEDRIEASIPLANGAILSAQLNSDAIDQKFQNSLILIITCAAFATALTTVILVYISNKISHPVQSLNNSALAIAAGQYGETAAIEGPKEVAELANTLNTMSECLLENINRLKENSLLRERMYGEYECAMLLQHLMLQKNIDDCRSDALAMKSLTLFSDTPRGLLLDFPKTEKPDQFQIHLAEACETGFEGMYELLSQYKHSKDSQTHTSILFNRSTSYVHFQGPHSPLFWSLDEKKVIEPSDNKARLESGDFFFLFNLGLAQLYKEPKAIQDLLTKVLKIFAQDGLETTASMLQKELTFATKRKEISEDIHLLCFQIL